MTVLVNPGTGGEPGSSAVEGGASSHVDALRDSLRDPEEFLRRLVESSEDCISVLDLEGRLLWMNAGGMRRLEIINVEALQGSTWFESWPAETRDMARQAVDAAANSGTIFLDEVSELPLEAQVKLLRVLQEQEFEPVGSSRTLRVDVRVIAATNRDLERAVREGKFRADLLYRLNVFPITVPPLRERASDIPLIAAFFTASLARKLGKPIRGFNARSMERLVRYAWPGNVRELQNIVERAAILSGGPVLELEGMLLGAEASAEDRLSAAPTPSALPADGDTLEDVGRAHIVSVLKTTGGVVGSQGRRCNPRTPSEYTEKPHEEARHHDARAPNRRFGPTTYRSTSVDLAVTLGTLYQSDETTFRSAAGRRHAPVRAGSRLSGGRRALIEVASGLPCQVHRVPRRLMLRISCECDEPAQVTVRLEGDVKGRWVEELRRECARVLGGAGSGGRRLVLDLAGVSSVDAAGLGLFRELGAESLLVKNCSPYLAELLKDVANVEP